MHDLLAPAAQACLVISPSHNSCLAIPQTRRSALAFGNHFVGPPGPRKCAAAIVCDPICRQGIGDPVQSEMSVLLCRLMIVWVRSTLARCHQKIQSRNASS